ncbi:succinate dehydrogenase assembly factor 2 family protein [Psychromonas sp. RZ22]|uniref:FAD assembly factor SdhE n=1 Tax=Psychromonas algarum TaxID=2555643 RepID=UPI001067DC1A|nr:succinate dehydrogenase assembly factor 2 [Psychromonas sp. RZ22]TEW53144.1 succinate dehydrogenase assembly factor 2 family protein [Psychromonas sp. RZ22]
MTEEVPLSRLLWACRRGMLELDVLFMPFVKEAYSGLSATHKLYFQRLLTCEDPELFAWFMGHEKCPDPQLAEIVDVIIKRVKV